MEEEGAETGVVSGTILLHTQEAAMDQTMMEALVVETTLVETIAKALVELVEEPMVVLVAEWAKAEASREETSTGMTNLKLKKMVGRVEVTQRIMWEEEEMTSGTQCLTSSLRREISLRISVED